MSQERTSVSKEVLGSLTSCLMEGSVEEQKATSKARRRALIASIIVQILVLAALVMYPMLSHGERLAATVFTPLPPYNPSLAPVHPIGDAPPPGRTAPPCRFCEPPSIPTIVPSGPAEHPISDPNEPSGSYIPGAPSGPFIPGTLNIGGRGKGPEPPRETPTPVKPPRISRSYIEAALLVHRVEPVYPILPLRMGREGHVELHAIIATDGSIQSLEVISGDPLFYASALAAVSQWRYQPTKLDGQAVEVDTQISVIYTLNR